MEAKDFWTKSAETWIQDMSDIPSAKADGLFEYLKFREAIVIDMIQKRHVKGRVLDVGFGSGDLLLHFAQRGFEIYGVDISPPFVERMRGVLSAYCSDPNDRVVETIAALKNKTFEFVTMLGILNYIEDQRDYVKFQIAPVVSPGGYVIATFTNPRSARVAWQALRNLTHVKTLLRFPKRVFLGNLILLRTGLPSGGMVNFDPNSQAYTPAKFEQMFKDAGFEVIEMKALFGIGKMDARFNERGQIANGIAKAIGWNRVYVFRKSA